MIKNIGLILSGLNESLTCNTDECLSFIIVFLNLLTIFYLVYSSYTKFTRITKLFGYVWSCLIMCASVIILAIHTCIFTIGGTIFTGMAIIAVLSMIFEHQKKGDEPQASFNLFQKKDAGCYVIFPTNDNNYVFGLYNQKNQLLMLSQYKFKTIDATKEGIAMARSYGENPEFVDLTQDWVRDAKYPKFLMRLEKEYYYFEFAINEDLSILKSEAIEESSDCLKMSKQARKCIKTSVIYLSSSKAEIKDGKRFKNFSN